MLAWQYTAAPSSKEEFTSPRRTYSLCCQWAIFYFVPKCLQKSVSQDKTQRFKNLAMPLLTVCYRPESNPDSIYGGIQEERWPPVHQRVWRDRRDVLILLFWEHLTPTPTFTHIHMKHCWNPHHNVVHRILCTFIQDTPRMMPIHPACTASCVGLSLSHTAIATVPTCPQPSCFSQPLRYLHIIAIAPRQPFLPSHLAPGSSPAAADIDPVTHGHKPMYILCSAGLVGKKLWLETEEQRDKDGCTIHLSDMTGGTCCCNRFTSRPTLFFNLFSVLSYFWPRMLFFECLSSSGGFFFLWTVDWFTEQPPSPVW